MKKKIRKVILGNHVLREIFFFLYKKKVYKTNIDKKIKKMSDAIVDKKKLKDLVISLTSYGTRLSELQYTLYSLVNQTIRAEKIIVNLALEDFNNVSTLLHSFQKYGVEFVMVEDIKSYKKLIPTLQKYPDKIIVTADDDLYYPRRWLEKLWINHLLNPRDIVCHLTVRIGFKENKLRAYNEWHLNKKESKASFSNLILSGAGALFPINSLYIDVCKVDLFMTLSPTADDIWDYFMAMLNKTKIRQIPNSYSNLRYVDPYREYGIIEGKTLTQVNVGLGKNDEQLLNILKFYNISETEFIEKIQSAHEGNE